MQWLVQLYAVVSPALLQTEYGASVSPLSTPAMILHLVTQPWPCCFCNSRKPSTNLTGIPYVLRIFSIFPLMMVSNAFLKLIKVITTVSLCSFTPSISLPKAGIWLTVFSGLNPFGFVHKYWSSLVLMQFRIILLEDF